MKLSRSKIAKLLKTGNQSLKNKGTKHKDTKNIKKGRSKSLGVHYATNDTIDKDKDNGFAIDELIVIKKKKNPWLCK